MTSRTPVEFIRQLANGQAQRAGNRVQIEGAEGEVQLPLTAPLATADQFVSGFVEMTDAPLAQQLGTFVVGPHGLLLKASYSNANLIYVGTQASQNIELAAGDELFLEIASAASVWVRGVVATDVISYVTH